MKIDNSQRINQFKTQIHPPFEVLAADYRSLKRNTEKGIVETLKSVIGLKDAEISKDDVVRVLSQQKKKLNQIKQELKKVYSRQNSVYGTCRKRIHRQEQIHQQINDNKYDYEDQFRTDIIQLMNCSGYTEEAKTVARVLKLQDHCMIEINLYEQIYTVSRAIIHNDLQPLKDWCYHNVHMINKFKSVLELKLVECQYINMLKNFGPLQAIELLRKNLSTLQLNDQHKLQVSKLTIMAISEQIDSIIIDPYLSQTNKIFMEVSGNIYNIQFKDRFRQTLTIGISCIKTPCCRQQLNNSVCPICNPRMKILSDNLPTLIRNGSCLVCRINGSPMDELNYPLALPSGQIYSLSGLEKTSKNGKYFCMNTMTYYDKSQAKKVYLT